MSTKIVVTLLHPIAHPVRRDMTAYLRDPEDGSAHYTEHGVQFVLPTLTTLLVPWANVRCVLAPAPDVDVRGRGIHVDPDVALGVGDAGKYRPGKGKRR